MLRQIDVRVTSVGEDVTLAIGNCAWLLGFEAALSLSALMRRCAADAKRAAGDHSRQWGVSGTLHDAERGPDADQPFMPGRVYPVARERMTAAQIGVRCEGARVAVKMGATEAKMPYLAAFTIAQWVRLRAKESKRRAGDARHWSVVAWPM